MSSATIDRYLAPAQGQRPDQRANRPPNPPRCCGLRSRSARPPTRSKPTPGFFEGDTVAHCGPTLKGEFARTLNLTDVHIGWVFTRTVRNNAHTHILAALKTGVHEIPYEVTGLDFDNGTEFLNKAVIKWAGEMEIFFTRSRPYKKNDQATIESKNNHLVRKYGVLLPLRHRRGTRGAQPALAAGQRPAQLPDPDHQTHRLRHPAATVSAAASTTSPQTPLDRLLAAGVLSAQPRKPS